MATAMRNRIDLTEKENLDFVKHVIRQQPDASRSEMSRQICRKLEWRRDNGDLKVSECRGELLQLDEDGLIDLPEVDDDWPFMHPGEPATELPEGCAECECGLEDLGDITLRRVGNCHTKLYRTWRDMMDVAHPLGRGNLGGGQIRYLLLSSEKGILGGLAFSSSAFALKCRSEHIRWTAQGREARRHNIVQNSRFLILPQVRVPNLASKVLALAEGRIVEDWPRKYHREVYMLETFVHPTYHSGGACYRAAGWEKIGTTAGRGRQDRHNKANKDKKLVFVKPTTDDWQGALCRLPSGTIKMRPQKQDLEPQNWAQQELGEIDVGDKRLDRRAQRMLRLRYAKPHAPIPATFIEDADLKAAYRFFKNEKTSMDKVLEPHVEKTIERADGHDTVLAAQDTTSLNYSNLNVMEGMGMINNTENDAQGVELHSTLAVTPEGLPLGFMDAQCWARDEEPKDWNDIKTVPIEQKESYKWIQSYRAATRAQKRLPDARVISVGDRESDIYELFLRAKHTEDGAGLLVRSEKSRRRETELKQLWEHMAELPVKTHKEVHIPARAGRPAREVRLEVRYSKVTLQPPKTSNHTERIQMWAVYAREKGEGQSGQKLEWMLLTTEPTESNDAAKTRLKQYSRRWAVEVFHRILKSGCKMEDRQMQTADRITTCLGLDMIVAWRVFYLTMLAREVPETSCERVFTPSEWKGAIVFLGQRPEAPAEAPPLGEMVDMVAKLGGYSKQKDPPGTEVMWRGLQRLSDIAGTYKAMAKGE